MTQPHLKINGVPIKNPTDLKRSTYNLTKSGRNADGRMSMDIIARKITLEITYAVLSEEDMDLITSLIDNGSAFFRVDHLYHNKYETFTAYAGAIGSTHFRHDLGWYWKDVTFSLIEQ